MVITTAQLYSSKPELRFSAGSNQAHGVSEIRDSEDLWQCSRLEIRLNAFRRLAMPQKPSKVFESIWISKACLLTLGMCQKNSKIQYPIYQISIKILKHHASPNLSFDQIRSFQRICLHLLKKFLMENFIFCAVFLTLKSITQDVARYKNSLITGISFYLRFKVANHVYWLISFGLFKIRST